MAAAEEPSSPAGLPDTQHDDEEWEEQRENFTLYYKTQNNTLRKSTELMIENHGFYATQRQWERRIAHWGLQKYTSRQARMEAIELQGRTIAEVAEPGRRSQGYLQPNDDRNVRRFARRELGRSTSRSRSRSRSQSFGNRSRSATPNVGRGRTPSAPDVIVRQEHMYNLDVSVLGEGNFPPASEATPVAIPALPTTQNSHFPQAHVMQTQNITTGETNSDVFLSLPNESLAQGISHMGTGLTGSQYGYDDMTSFMNDQMMAEVPMPNQTTPFPQLDIDTTIPPDFITSQDPLSNQSPSYIQAMAAPWNPPIFDDPDYGGPQDFVQERSHSNHSSFHQTPTDNLSHTRSVESSIDSHQAQNMVNVPNIVFPSEHSPTFEPAVPAFQPQQVQTYQSKDPTIYEDFYSSISRYTQGMENAVMQFANAHGATRDVQTQLANELHSQS